MAERKQGFTQNLVEMGKGIECARGRQLMGFQWTEGLDDE